MEESRNKVVRAAAYAKAKVEKKKAKRERRSKRKQLEEKLGDKAPPKQVPRTIESTRTPDNTVVDPQDEEVAQDEATDELSEYFLGKPPKILLTTSRKPVGSTFRFVDELLAVFTDAEFHERRAWELKDLTKAAVEQGFTDILVVNEDSKKPNGIILSHLPNGPTAHFKLSSIKYHKDIRNRARGSSHKPELVLNNFDTRLGHSVGRMLASLFPHEPDFKGRRVVTFHNQRDFIFFRHHRYVFRDGTRAGLQEIGPRFTLKLDSLQIGTFDSKYGEYEWVHKRREMDADRKKFAL